MENTKAFTTTHIAPALLLPLWVYAFATKTMAFGHFESTLSSAPFIGEHAAIIAPLILVAEAIAALLLFIPQTQIKGLWASALLLIAFSAYIGCMLLMQKHLPCSCGGIIEKLSWRQHLLFNTTFLLFCFAGIYANYKTAVSPTNKTKAKHKNIFLQKQGVS